MEEKFCGVWGHLREEFLKAHNPEMYKSLSEKLAEKLTAERGENEELYKNDSLEWILETEKIQEEVKAKLAEEICR